MLRFRKMVFIGFIAPPHTVTLYAKLYAPLRSVFPSSISRKRAVGDRLALVCNILRGDCFAKPPTRLRSSPAPPCDRAPDRANLLRLSRCRRKIAGSAERSRIHAEARA